RRPGQRPPRCARLRRRAPWCGPAAMRTDRGSADPADLAIGPAPRSNPDLLGQEAAEGALRRLFETGRLPHALLLCGPRGIGKATLAFRFARFVLANGGGEGALVGLLGD